MIRPSGKIITFLLSLTALINDFVDIGLVGSILNVSTRERRGLNHHCFAVNVFTAKVILSGKKAAINIASRNHPRIDTVHLFSPKKIADITTILKKDGDDVMYKTKICTIQGPWKKLKEQSGTLVKFQNQSKSSRKEFESCQYSKISLVENKIYIWEVIYKDDHPNSKTVGKSLLDKIIHIGSYSKVILD